MSIPILCAVFINGLHYIIVHYFDKFQRYPYWIANRIRNTDIFRTQLHTRCIVQQMIKAHVSSRHAIRITSIHLCNFNAINILLSCQISCVVYMFCECMSEFGVQLQSGTTCVQRNFVCSCGGSDSELSPVRKSTRQANIYYNLIRKKFDKHSNFILSKY